MPAMSTRRFIVTAAFVAALVAVVILNARASGSVARAAETIHLSEVAHASGIDFVHQQATLDPKIANIAPHVGALGACVSVADVNNDGWPDLYFTTSRFGAPNALYLNQKDGTFRDIAADAGVALVNRPGEGVSMGAVWGDYDNDGYEDLLVYKWGYLQLFHNLGNGRFEDVTEQAGLKRWMNSNGAVWFDFDRDGLLDLYVTGYFRSDIDFWHLKSTRIMQQSWEFASNGGKNLLFKNLGNGHFKDVTDSLGVGSTRWTLAAAAADFNDDGWPDLYLANDYGPEELFLNHEGKRFELARAGLEDDSKSGMAVALGDVYNRGRLDAFVTNISERGFLFQGNNLRINFLRELGRFDEVATGVVADAGWAWGGAVRRPEQRRPARSRHCQRLHLRRQRPGLLVRDVEDRRRAGQHLRGREELAGHRHRKPLRVRALARAAQSWAGGIRGCRRAGRCDGPARRARGRDGRSVQHRFARCDHRQ
jgi:hypothetical protein